MGLQITLKETRSDLEGNENKISELIKEKEGLQVSLQDLEEIVSSNKSNIDQSAELEGELLETTELNEELNVEVNTLKEEINRLKSGILESETDYESQVKELQNEKDKATEACE